MATLLEKYHASRADSDLRKKVEAALVDIANVIRGEDAGTANHAARLAWANGFLFDSGKVADGVQRGVVACIANPTIGANPAAATDNDITFVITNAATDIALASGA